MWNADLFQKIVDCGQKVFAKKAISYPYHTIISGVVVRKCRQKAVSFNTWRSYHRKDTSKQGVSQVFEAYFNSPKFISNLKGVKTEKDLHNLSNKALKGLRYKFNDIVKEPLGENNYGKLRKPIDLVMEHVVVMSSELVEVREILIPLLFLPLDSEMFKNPLIFSDEILQTATTLNNDKRINRRSTYNSIKTEEAYLHLQKAALRMAKDLSEEYKSTSFKRIYFDLFWNNRYQRDGGNLFELNI